MTRAFTPESSALVLPDPEHSFWARIAHEIAHSIRKGIYAPGERLPSAQVLAQRYGVNRHTVRRSLTTLGQLGLVRSEQGSGTYVEDFAVDLVLRKRTRHRQNLKQAGFQGGVQVLDSIVEPADADTDTDTDTATALKLRAGKLVLHLTVLGHGGGQPLHVSDRYFPLPRFLGLDAHLRETGSITESVARLGIADSTRLESRISARLPSEVVADYLCQPSSRPALLVTSVNIDIARKPIEYACTWFAGDRVTIAVNHEND
jgi:GntR family phosphonate transport system transcriptional regulator